jgi:CRISPR-associated protein Cas2
MKTTKFMRIILMFDLPTETSVDKKQYALFRKNIIKLGYTMIQYSIYMKTINVQTKTQREIKKIQDITPKQGNIRLLIITELQYNNMKLIKGEMTLNEKINNNIKHIII